MTIAGIVEERSYLADVLVERPGRGGLSEGETSVDERCENDEIDIEQEGNAQFVHNRMASERQRGVRRTKRVFGEEVHERGARGSA